MSLIAVCTVAFIVRCFFGARCILAGKSRQHHVSASRVGPSLGARVDVVWKGYGTFRGTVVEGEDASKCWVLCYDDDGLCYALGRRRYTVVDDAEADGGPRNTRARTGGMQDVHSNVIRGCR